ncbi:MAG TPA: MinD/ParA family protein [Halanaerobiales bacterium]|nr:MinD/ParA family protein [Halanaerobiales bacterium]
MNNQAAKLKDYMESNNIKDFDEIGNRDKDKQSRIIAVASGKGGVGKSTITVNLALALRELEKEVFLIDSDIGMANIDVLLGLKTKYDLNHVLKGLCSLKQAVETGPYGLNVLSGISGIDDVLNISNENIKHLLSGVTEIERNYDVILLDTGAGASQSVINFTTAADEILIVLTPEPTSIMDSYSLIKLLSSSQYRGKLHLVVNRVDSQKEADSIIDRFITTARKYLDLNIDLLGTIPNDNLISKSIKKQHPVFKLYPESEVNDYFLQLAGNLIGKELDLPSRGIKNFFYKLIGQIAPGR